MTAPKRTQLGLGVPLRPAPSRPVPAVASAPAPEPLPSYEADVAAGFHEYGEDDDAATMIMASPLDEAELAGDTSSIATAVHAPPKSQHPAPQPEQRIVVDQPYEDPYAYQQVPPSVHPASAPPPTVHPASVYPAPPPRNNVMVALIAAATTLAALALTALVVLKLAERPPLQVVAQPALVPAAPQPAPPVDPGSGITAPQKPAQAATVVPKPDEPKEEVAAVDPSDLPEERASPAPVAFKPRTQSGPRGGLLPKKKKKAANGPPGFLTVVCDPFCDSVSAAGRGLGPSPVVRAALPPGNHGVVLRSKGQTKSIGVKIVSGQTTARRVKMGR